MFCHFETELEVWLPNLVPVLWVVEKRTPNLPTNRRSDVDHSMTGTQEAITPYPWIPPFYFPSEIRKKTLC